MTTFVSQLDVALAARLTLAPNPSKENTIMSTHSIVARPVGSGWEGRYIHFDGYPTGVGWALFQAHRNAFDGDTAEMRRALVDAEPVGWSSITGCDLSLPGRWTDEPEYQLPAEEREKLGPLSYSASGETPLDGVADRWLPGGNAVEWLYVLTDEGLSVGRGVGMDVLIPWGASLDDALEALVAAERERRTQRAMED